MQIIPAIDIKDGRCVRLRQGRMDDETVFSDDPIGMAEHWISLGAKRLHIVDLDGAKAGTPQQMCDQIQVGPGFCKYHPSSLLDFQLQMLCVHFISES